MVTMNSLGVLFKKTAQIRQCRRYRTNRLESPKPGQFIPLQKYCGRIQIPPTLLAHQSMRFSPNGLRASAAASERQLLTGRFHLMRESGRISPR